MCYLQCIILISYLRGNTRDLKILIDLKFYIIDTFLCYAPILMSICEFLITFPGTYVLKYMYTIKKHYYRLFTQKCERLKYKIGVDLKFQIT